MAIDFPSSPNTNDTFTSGSITYKWDGAKWIGLGVTPSDKLVEGSNKLEIDGSNQLVWTGSTAKFGGVLQGDQRVIINGAGGKSGTSNTLLNYAGDGSTVTASLTADGFLVAAAGHFTANVTPTSGRGVEIFEASAGVGQIQSFNRTNSSWDELKLKGSEVRIHTGSTNALTLDLQKSASTLYGTTDGVLNIDTTDGRGAFIRFKENGTTKAWVGSPEGMGGGLSGDQDDLGLRAVDNIMFSANGAERLRITSDGEVTKPNQPGFIARQSASETTWTIADGWQKIEYDEENMDRGGNFSTSNSEFTAPVAGMYLFGCELQLENPVGASTGSWMYIAFVVNGQTTLDESKGGTRTDVNFEGHTYNSYHPTHLMNLAAGDKVCMYRTGGSFTSIKFKGGPESVFWGYLVG